MFLAFAFFQKAADTNQGLRSGRAMVAYLNGWSVASHLSDRQEDVIRLIRGEDQVSIVTSVQFAMS